MTTVIGEIITGEFDSEVNQFLIQKVKNQATSSVLNERQLSKLYRYLKQNEICGENYQVITLYDQMIIPLSQQDIKALVSDLEKIQCLYH